eukprot:CAMPEP_0198118216 /NCGR_PEP_ID=MMETSP1442-20131203/20798_1 /TAXON_ID= /ORGANISM="Craspedostauros australis, Strain CCMP3328" /LENGTH=36 /DNA_ID= /DNA_START= /DNA_END= /DNA_ORIENTATION=
MGGLGKLEDGDSWLTKRVVGNPVEDSSMSDLEKDGW